MASNKYSSRIQIVSLILGCVRLSLICASEILNGQDDIKINVASGTPGSVIEFYNSIAASDLVKELTLSCASKVCPVEWKLEKYRVSPYSTVVLYSK